MTFEESNVTFEESNVAIRTRFPFHPEYPSPKTARRIREPHKLSDVLFARQSVIYLLITLINKIGAVQKIN